MGAPQEQARIRFNRIGKPYLVRRFYVGKKRREQWIPLDNIDQDTLQAALQVKQETLNEVVAVPCMNPKCKHTVPMTKKQLEEFFISSKKRYDMMILPFCGKECRDLMLAQHGGALPGSDQS